MSTIADDPHDGVIASGVGRLRLELRDAKDRFIASDPGWARLRQGIRAAVAVGSTLLIEDLFAKWVGQPAVLAVLLGAVVAMVMSTGIREGRHRIIARMAIIGSLAAATGAALGVLTAPHHVLGLATFVAVSFVAVWVRRFGQRWFTFGFVFWQSFFFALYLHPPVTTLPYLVLAVIVGGLWVGVLLLTVLYDDPEAKLRRIVVALRARARSGISAALDVLEDPSDAGRAQVMRRNLVQLSEVALLLDGQLADSRALPDGVLPGRLRRWTVDVEIGMDEVCAASAEIAARRDELREPTVAAVRQVLQTLGWGDKSAALLAAHELAAAENSEVPALRRLGSAATFLLETVDRWDAGELSEPASGGSSANPSANRADLLDEADDFEPVVNLVGGNLPGTAALAQISIASEDAGRWSPSRLRLTTRQAIQAAVAAGLAILAGEVISTQRFYWAVIAAFVGFAGTASSGETLRKGLGRIGGTLAGLIAAVGLANVTSEHTPFAIGAILLCILFAFFLQPISYAAMVFFTTMMLGQLYTLLGTFSDELLALRLAETVVGATIGIVVSLVVLPTHSRATLRAARKDFLQAMCDLFDACAETLEGREPDRDLLTLTVLLDAGGRQIVRTRRALTKGRMFGADRVALRHRISVLGACGASARALAGSIAPDRPNSALAQATRELAVEARRLGDSPELSDPLPPSAGAPALVDRVRPLVDQAAGDEVHMATIHAIERLSEALALLTPRPAAAPKTRA